MSTKSCITLSCRPHSYVTLKVNSRRINYSRHKEIFYKGGWNMWSVCCMLNAVTTALGESCHHKGQPDSRQTLSPSWFPQSQLLYTKTGKLGNYHASLTPIVSHDSTLWHQLSKRLIYSWYMTALQLQVSRRSNLLNLRMQQWKHVRYGGWSSSPAAVSYHCYSRWAVGGNGACL